MITDRNLSLAGLFLLISAAAHVIAPVLSGFSGFSLFLAGVGVTYALIALGLRRGMRWLACLTFFIMLIGINVSWAGLGATTAPDWLLWIFILADLAVAVFLFRYIWTR